MKMDSLTTQDSRSIDLINFHFANNYGAVLQCLALQTFIEKQGGNVHIIDYRPYYQRQYYIKYPSPFRGAYWKYKREQGMPLLKRIYDALRWFARTIYQYQFASNRASIQRAFQPFVHKHLHLTRQYSSLRALRRNPPNADIYICGSDQLWNPNVTFGLDPAYFLDFGVKKTRRYAFSVSPCAALDESIYGKQLAQLLQRFDAISLREAEKRDLIERLYKQKVDICMDSTFLLSAQDYEQFEEPLEIQEPYILVYAFKESDGNVRMKEVLETVVAQLNYKVIDISLDNVHWQLNVQRKFAITPGQFLSYFKNAYYIVTNSFHGTAFSIIYQKQFISVTKTGTEQRVTELLEKLGLCSALIKGDLQPLVLNKLDYTIHKEQREQLIANSREYLRKLIGVNQ